MTLYRFNMRSWAQTALALLAPSLPLALGQHIRDLSGDGWTLSAPLLDRTVPARTPSYAHLDLLRSGVIGKSFFVNVGLY